MIGFYDHDYTTRQRLARLERSAMLTPNPWENVPKQYAGRWAYEYDDHKQVFFVHCGGHRILDAEDSEVCAAVCTAHNSYEA